MTDIIRDMPYDDRPREKLLARGAPSLTEAELLALVLGCGTQGKNALQLARELLADGMPKLVTRPPSQTARLFGMGQAKAARLCATFELARRISEAEPVKRPQFDFAKTGIDLVRTLARQRQERLGGFFLDARHHVIAQREIFVGTITNALVSTREILRTALDEDAVAIVLYHNHPSGNPDPSAEDVTFTTKLRDSLALADIELLEHLVIGAHGFVSMKGKGMF